MARTGPAIQTTVRSCPFEGVRRALKTQVLENASTEKASTVRNSAFREDGNACTENASTNLQGWKTQIRKMQVQCKPSVR